MATTTSMSLPSLPPLPSIVKPRSYNSSLLFTSPLSLSSSTFLSTKPKPIHFHNPAETNRQKKSNKIWLTFATAEEVLPSDSIPLDTSEQIISSSGDEGVATIIQVLLFVAFVALTILTLGVIYIGVQDFLGKREREKFEKEEAAKKTGKKKKKVRARAGPKGFGQKLDQDDDFIDV
ncbi:hypothetical protein CCACVL1_23078 [Corchorus capsularis]|uniref:Uncharacterized protein n=1 Tax=Corchorus capsularis TaxID=210143 RepID=A0A1R3GVG0_COCAP|nr:hypothetical protein CCACVL1_23078 [Corchorus capsularis]